MKRLITPVAWLLVFTPIATAQTGGLAFEGKTDVGKIDRPGSVTVLNDGATFRITGSGANMWNREDACHFTWKKVSGDLTMTADVAFEGAGTDPHRKAGWMVRQSLDADSPYADVAVHGDGLIELQYRKEKGGLTKGVRAPIKAPAAVKLERDGNLFTLSVAPNGGPMETVGALSVPMDGPVYAGLYVCSHNATVSETAVISKASLKEAVVPSGTKRVRETSLEVLDTSTGRRRLVYRERGHFEAPNWSRDGKSLLINRGGKLFTVPAEGANLSPLDTGGLNRCNNDHGYSPDGQWLAISHRETNASLVYVIPSSGGSGRKITEKGPSYWHGWSPDGKTLAYCAERAGAFDIYTIPVDGGAETRLTDAPGLDDGPDYSPDGKSLYWNSERSGLMKIWRMDPDGANPKQVTADADFADWFPHPSPDGSRLIFISFDATVKGHPEDKDVVLRVMPLPTGKPTVVATLFGGQGTLNVPSWSPDGRYVAFVSYRHVAP
jgi:TolB protein